MNAVQEDDHTWFRRRLPDHLLDLLVEDERERFDRHARTCTACAQLLSSAQGARRNWWDGAGHPPVDVLLKWNPAAHGDRTQALARAHVASCEACRQDLEDLLGVPASRAGTIVPFPPRRTFPVPSRGLAVAAGLVAIASVTLLLTRVGEAPPGAPGSAPAPPAAASGSVGAIPSRGGPAASPAPPAGGRTAQPVTLASAERGPESGATILRVEPGVTQVPLTLPALFIPDGTPMAIELRDAAGRLVSRQQLPSDRALRPGGVLLPVEGLAAGTYRLVVRWTDDTLGETTREFALDVRTSR